jgi:putative spermidine/putrescine transport system permease protein
MNDLIPFWRRLWLRIIAILVLAFLIAPILVVVPMSFSPSSFLEFPPQGFSLRWYAAFFSSNEWVGALMRSFQAGVLTAVLSVPLGVAAAYGLQYHKTRLTAFISGALMAPMIAPVIVVAIGIFYLYARLGLVNTLLGLVLAHSVLAVPFVLLTISSGLDQFDANQEMVARTLGATRFTAFRTVTFPQIRPFVLASALFAFITSFDEVVIALFISRGNSSTLPRKMFSSLRDELSPTISAISTLLIALSLVVALIIAYFLWSSKSTST